MPIFNKRDQGSDWAIYQGNLGKYGTKHDKFAVAQIGGWSNGIYEQSTYIHQVANMLANKVKAHTYIWYQVGSSIALSKQILDYFLPRVTTPKGSIVALD